MQADTKRRGGLYVAVLCLLVLVTFGLTARFGFVNWDDDVNVYRNEFVTGRASFSWAALRADGIAQSYPLTILMWRAVAALTHELPVAETLNPLPFHITNLLLHVLCVLLVFRLLRWLDLSGPAALVGAAIFAVHPLQAEAVAWVTGAKDLLSACLGLSAVTVFLRLEKRKGPLLSGLGYVVASLLFAAALLAKPTSAVLVPMAAALLLWKGDRRKIMGLLPWAAMAVLGLAVAKFAQPDQNMPRIVAIWQRPFVAGDAVWFYLSRMVAPLRLSPLHLRAPDYVMDQWWAYATWLIPLTTVILLWIFFRVRGLLVAALFVVPLFPVLGFVPFHYQSNVSSVADRYVYLAMLAPALGVGWLLDNARRVLAMPRVLGLLVAGLLAVLGLTSAFQALHWRNSFTLFHHSLTCLADKEHPAADRLRGRAYAHLAAYSNNHGAPAAAEKFSREAIRLQPAQAEAYITLAYSLAIQGRHAEAVRIYDAILQKEPHNRQVRQLRDWAATKDE